MHSRHGIRHVLGPRTDTTVYWQPYRFGRQLQRRETSRWRISTWKPLRSANPLLHITMLWVYHPRGTWKRTPKKRLDMFDLVRPHLSFPTQRSYSI